jgi:hypothetical protein
MTERETTPATIRVAFVDPTPPSYSFADVDGDRLMITTADIPGQGAGVYFRTDVTGSSVPVAEIPALIDRLREIAEASTSAERVEVTEDTQAAQQ